MYHISQYYIPSITHHTSCITSHNFISKISIEIPYRAPLRAVKRTELSGSSGACMGLPFVPIRSQHAVALSPSTTMQCRAARDVARKRESDERFAQRRAAVNARKAKDVGRLDLGRRLGVRVSAGV